MDLLAKFAAVEVKSDNRISEADKAFCEAHQSAYDSARTSLVELQYFWEDILQNQEKLLEGTDTNGAIYLTGGDSLEISPEKINEQLKTMHNTFINQLVTYFSHLYHVTISNRCITDELLPQKPECHTYDKESREQYKKQKEQYESDLQNLSLTYDNVLEQIFSQMDGRGLWEQALYELKTKCHNGAWNYHNKKAEYELQKDILRFPKYGCSYKGTGRWELWSACKDILRGIAHFETGSFSYIPAGISGLLGYWVDCDLTIFHDCEKIKQLKLFKNGRVDIKFADANLAKQFVEDYLGTVY